MSSIYYLDNRDFTLPKNNYFFVERENVVSSLRAGTLKKIIGQSFFTPSIFAFLGLFLIGLSFFPSFVLAGRVKDLSEDSYPTQIADNTSRAKESKLPTKATVKAAKVEESPYPLVSFSSQSVSTAFGRRSWPVRGGLTTYYSGYHQGLDIAVPYGTGVAAFADGVVVSVVSQGWGFGNYITIRHADGLETTYAHLSAFTVSKGQVVSAGTMIGRVGSSGYATGAHLHFQVEKGGVTLNPLSVLP